MKQLLTGLVVTGLFSSAAIAAPIMVDFGFNNIDDEGIIAPVNGGDMAVMFTSPDFGVGSCSDDVYCGNAAMIGSTMMVSGGPTTITWGTGELVYTTTSDWDVIETVVDDDSFFLIATDGVFTSNVPGAMETPGNVNFSFQDPIIVNNNGEEAIQYYSFSASGATSPIPEPGTFALLGAGLIGLGVVSRRRLGSSQ